jgi:hypothetical protein
LEKLVVLGTVLLEEKAEIEKGLFENSCSHEPQRDQESPQSSVTVEKRVN